MAGYAAGVEPSSRALIDWLVASGAEVAGLRVGPSGDGRGVFTTREIATGEPILSVPAACLVLSQVVARTELGHAVAERWGEAHPILLAAWLAHALRERDRRWAPYLASLPTTFPRHPQYYGPDEIHALRGTAFVELLAARRGRLMEEYAWTRGVPELAGLEPGEWLLARALATSRSFSCGRGEAFVPFADLMNHAVDPGTSWSCDPLDGFRLRAERDIPAGSEVFDGYGRKSNSRLLIGYGFTLPDNRADDVELVLGELGAYRLTAEEGAPEIERLLLVLGAGEGAGARERAIGAFADLCRARLAALPDEEAPAVERATERLRDALAVRESERRVYRFWAERG